MPKRRLAAIMFTDIEGYTQMMAEDESRAHIIRQRHREVFEELHEKHKGEIIQYFGDGTLSIFDSCVEAVRCAIAMQQAFQEEPQVPLRIGIHLGDIEYSKTEVAGNGVNITSRVESLGVAGTVLISDGVRKQVDNHQITTVSMGHFEMKNVPTPMEVFAVEAEGLHIPNPKSLQGKAKRINAKLQTQKMIRFASIGFVAMLLGAVLFWAFGANDTEGQLSDNIKEERVAIIPFKNLTTDTNLEVFGDFCSNLITHGLTEAGIKTCSPQTIQQYNHLIGSLPNNPEGKPAFSEVVGVRYWIAGNFSKTGDTLSVKSHLTDGTNGDIVRNFPEMRGHIEDKEKLVDELAKRLMGYWVARDQVDKGKFKPPKYEAFQKYQKIFTTDESGWWAREYALKAFALDTTFYLAALEEMFWQAEAKSILYDSLHNLLTPHYEQMTSYERLRFDAYEALYKRDYSNYTRRSEALYQMFPQDLSHSSHYSWHLGWRENQPLKAWEIINNIDWKNISEELHQFRKRQMFRISLFGLGIRKYREIIDFVEAYNPQDGLNFQIKSFIYARTNQLDSLYALADKLSTLEKMPWVAGFAPEYDYVNFCNDVGEEFLLQEKPEEAKQFLQMALNWTAEKPERLSTMYDSLDLARTYRLLGEPQKSLILQEPFISTYMESNLSTRWDYARYFSGIGIDYALLGQEEKARRIIENIKGATWGAYFKARVHAVLGEKEEAMRWIREWRVHLGCSYFSAFFYKHDYFMKNMFGYAPFEEFTRVRD